MTFSSQGGDVISTILRREVTYDQKQGTCAEVRGQQKFSETRMDNVVTCLISLQHFNVANANCTRDSDCVKGEVDFDGHGTFFYSSQNTFSSFVGVYLPHFYAVLNTFLQEEGPADVFLITTTPSKPARSKAGVLLSNMLL